MHKCIVVIGNVGAGKTTLAETLAREKKARLVPADELYKTNPFFPLALEDRKRWSLASDLWFLQKRVELTREIPGFLEKSDVVVDSGLPMSWVYAHSRLGQGYFTKDELDLYETCYAELTVGLRQPDEVVYLNAPVVFLRKRIITRGRAFEIQHHSLEYLQSLQKSLEVLVEHLTLSGVSVREEVAS